MLHPSAVLRCAAAALLFGATTPIAARLAGELGAFRLAGLLYLGAALAVAPVVARRPAALGAWRVAARPLAVAIVAGGAIGPVLLAAGLLRTPAATASLLLNLELVATTVIAAAVFREHIGPRVAGGTALVAVAGAVLSWSANPELRAGALLVAAACVFWAIDNCVTASLDQISPERITLAKGVVAGGANLALGLVAAGLPALGDTVAALAVGAVGYGASITLWVHGARDLGAARAQLVFATAPFLGAIVAWTAFSEALTARQMVATALAVAGVGLVARSAHDHRHRHEPMAHAHEHDHDDGHHDHEHDHHHGHHRRPARGPHDHPHRHDELVHAHTHVPDLHHRHRH